MSELGFTIVTIIALIVGPISAVFITRLLDDRRASRDRRWDIFRNLMRYRGTGLHAEFVGALNLGDYSEWCPDRSLQGSSGSGGESLVSFM